MVNVKKGDFVLFRSSDPINPKWLGVAHSDIDTIRNPSILKRYVYNLWAPIYGCQELLRKSYIQIVGRNIGCVTRITINVGKQYIALFSCE